jgi:hypothetical protein
LQHSSLPDLSQLPLQELGQLVPQVFDTPALAGPVLSRRNCRIVSALAFLKSADALEVSSGRHVSSTSTVGWATP